MNGLTEQDYAAAFGVELPEETPAEDTAQETAEPEEADADAPEVDIAEGTETPTGPETAEEAPESQEQSMEERRRQAHGRRQREWEAERQAMLTAAQARVDAVYADMFRGQVNPYTGKPIQGEADYQAYRQAEDAKQRGDALRSAGVDPDALKGMVEDAVRPLRQQVEQQKLQSMSEMARAVNRQAEAVIQQGVENIRARYGAEVQSVKDILALPTGQAFSEYVKKGLPLEDAYYLANRESADRHRMAAARQAGINQAAGKRHLRAPERAAGDLPYTATAEEAAAYREMMPDATDAEINAAYAAYHKQ